MDIFRPYLDTCMSPISDNSSIESARISQLILEEGRYLGELKESLMCGTGIFLWNNGDSYFGEWQAHKPHGQGCFLFNDGIYIEGNFASGRVSGVAGIYYPNGSYLKGNFHCGKLKDRALFYNSEEDVWSLRDYTNKDDSTVLFEGKGNPVAYNYSSSTQGQGFRDLAMHINMNTNIDVINDWEIPPLNFFKCITAERLKTITSPYLGCFQIDSDTRHFGYFENGKISGLGVRVSSCIIENGDYHEGELNGHGYRIEPNQLIYIGNFENGAFSGQGTLFDLAKMMKSEGEFYKGVFLNPSQQTSFTLNDLQSSSVNQGHMEPINAHFAQLFKIRSYQHLFSISRKSSPKSSSANSVANSSRPESEAAAPAEKYQVTTIKEVAKAKIISKEVIISTEELPQDALQKPFLDINSHNTSVDINNLALSMQKSPENIDKAIELSTKCIEHLKNRLEKFQSVPRSKRVYIDEKETSERPFSRAFSIEVTPLSPTEKRRTKSRDAILPNPPRLSLQNYQSTFRVSIDELKRTSPKIKIESLLQKETNRLLHTAEPELVTPIKQETTLTHIKTSELKTLPSNHSPADEIGILNSYKSEKSIASLPSQFSVHEALQTVPNPCQVLKNLPLKSHMETCDTHDNTYDFSTKIPSRVSLHDIPDLSSSCVLKGNNNTSNSRICMTSTKDSITRSTSARNSAKGPNPLQRDMNIEVTPKTGNKNGYINLAQICAATSQTNRGNPLTKPLRADHLFKTPLPNEENSYPSLWQNQDQTLRSSFTQAVSEVQQPASTKRANSTQNNEKKPYVSPYTVTFKAKEYQNQKATSRSVTKKSQPQTQKALNRTNTKEDLNASINSKRTSRSGSIQANKGNVNKSMVLNTSTASRKSSKDVIPKRNTHVIESPKGRRTPANVPTLESNQSSQEFVRLNEFDLEAVKRDIMNGSVENVIKVLSAKKTTPAAPTQERRSKWKIPSEELPLQSDSSRLKGLKEQDTNKSSVSSSTYNKIKNSMRSDSPVICLNLERTQNNDSSSFVSSSETEQPKLKLLLNSQSMSRASIGNNSHLDIESVTDKRLRMSDLESSPAIRNLTKQKENSNPRKPTVTKANTRVNQSMDYLRPTITSNQKKPVPGIKHITPVKKVSPVAAVNNNSFQQQGTPKDSDILTITSIASSQKSKSPQSKISCKFVNSIQIGHADHQNTSHPNMKFEYVDTVRSSFCSQSNFNQTKTEQKVLSQFAKYSSFEIQRQAFTEPVAPEEEEEESPRLLATYGIQSHFGIHHEQNEDYEDITSPQTPNKEKMFSFQNQSALKRANELDSVRSSKPEFNNDPVRNLPSDRKKSPGRVTTSMSSKVEFDVFKRLSDPGYQTFDALRNQIYDTKNTEPHEPITEKYEEEKEYRLDTQEFEDFVEQLQVRAQNMQSKYETLIIDESQEVGEIKPISFDLKAHTLTDKPHGSTSRSHRSSKELEHDEPSSDLQLETQSVTEPEIPKDSYQSVRIRTTEETHPRITEPDSPVFNIKENSKRLSLQSQQTSQRSHDDLKRRSFAAQPVFVPTVTSLHETVKDLHCPPQSKAGVSTKAHSFASQGGNTSNSLREMGSVPVSLTSLLDQTSKNNFKANIDKLFQEPKVIPSKQFIHKAPSKQISVNDKKGFPRTPLMYKEQSSARVDLEDSGLKVNVTLSKNNRSMASYSNEQNQQEESSVLIERNCNIGPKFMDKENLFKEKRVLEDDEISDDDDDIPEERPNQTTNGTTDGKYYTDERFMTGSDKFSNEKKFSFENGALYTDNTLGDEILKIR